MCDITNQVLLLTIYTTRGDDMESDAALGRLKDMTLDGLRVYIKPSIMDTADTAQMQLVCPTTLGTNNDEIVLNACNAAQVFCVTIVFERQDSDARATATELATMLGNRKLGYMYSLLDNELDFDPATDMPEEVDKDPDGNRRTYFAVGFDVHFVDGRFVIPPEEEDEEDDDPDSGDESGDWNFAEKDEDDPLDRTDDFGPPANGDDYC